MGLKKRNTVREREKGERKRRYREIQRERERERERLNLSINKTMTSLSIWDHSSYKEELIFMKMAVWHQLAKCSLFAGLKLIGENVSILNGKAFWSTIHNFLRKSLCRPSKNKSKRRVNKSHCKHTKRCTIQDGKISCYNKMTKYTGFIFIFKFFNRFFSPQYC